MKKISDIVIIIQARLNSERVSQKMIRPFADSNLFEIAIKKLLASKEIPKDNIYLSINEPDLKIIGQKYNLNIYERSE